MKRFETPAGRGLVWPALLLLVPVVLLAGRPAVAQTTRGAQLTEVTEERLALVIGNAGYRKLTTLDNPVNDARLNPGLPKELS